jgi:adenylate cyclase
MMERLRMRAVRGNVHGDLNGFNVLVGGRDAQDESYYLIDLAHFHENQFLFFDNDYLGFSHLLAVREEADEAHWDSLLAHVCHSKGGQSAGPMRGDDLGPIEVIRTLREEVLGWIERHEFNRLSFMESQLYLASVAVGLNFASKGIDERLRRLGFIYAAACLRSYVELHHLDWPRHGPPFVLETGVQAASVIKDGTTLSDDEHPELPDKLAIAVLAFKNLSADPDQEYFADGMTEEISTMLSHSDWLMVISRGSTFAYKDRDVPLRQIAQELGVHYVVEGTVQKAGDKVRVTVQLTDAIDAAQLWSERYQRDLDDIFAIQEEIARAIATNLDIELKMAEIEHASRRQSHIGIWDRFQQGMWHFFKFTDSDAAVAITQWRKLLDQTPGFAPALAALSLVTTRQLMLGEDKDPQESLARATRYAEDAVAADDKNSLAHMALARVLLLSGQHVRATEEAQTAVDLNPSSSGALLTLAHALLWQGRSEDALPAIDMSLRLSPKGPLRDFKLMARAFALYTLDRLDEAEQAARKAAYGNRMRIGGLLILIAILARQGRAEEAKDAIHELQTIRADVTLSTVSGGWTGMSAAVAKRITNDLRDAGLPE